MLTIAPDQVAEAAVVGINDELTGQAVNAFVAVKEKHESADDQIRKDLVQQVRKSIGPFAAPKTIFMIDDLPKTRSGKIMRRILRKIVAGEEDQLGDTSTVSFGRPDKPCRSLANQFTAGGSKRRRPNHRGRAEVEKAVRTIRVRYIYTLPGLTPTGLRTWSVTPSGGNLTSSVIETAIFP